MKSLTVPGNFPLEYADPLRKHGFKLELKGDPFFEKRTIKTKKEVAAIRTAIRHVEHAFGLAVKTLKKTTTPSPEYGVVVKIAWPSKEHPSKQGSFAQEKRPIEISFDRFDGNLLLSLHIFFCTNEI